MKKILNGLTIVVTRPEHQSKTLCEKIIALGGNPILYPCIEIRDPVDKTSLLRAVSQLDKANIAIFFSPNAVSKAKDAIHHAWPSLPLHLKIAAIGKSTADALRAAHFPVDFYPHQQFNSEALLNCVELQSVAQKNIILFQGEEGRDIVAPALQKRGATVTKAIAYRRTVPSAPLPNLNMNQIDLVITTSNDGLKNLIHLVGDEAAARLKQLPLLVVSHRMLLCAESLGFSRTPIMANDASDDGIIAALKLWKEGIA
jgi:uroporphyrinogen-III synthase